MTIFPGHSPRYQKYELSSRPKRSEVDGPAVRSISIKRTWKRDPPLCHPERSRGICSSADLSWRCFSRERSREPALSEVEGDLLFSRLVLEMFFRGSGLGFEARRADCQTSAQPGRAGAQIGKIQERRRRGTLSPQPELVFCRKNIPGRARKTAFPPTVLRPDRSL
jgi:hypothetical protein